MLTVPRLVSVAAGLALIAAPGAGAGGWWSSIDLDRSAVTAGQRVDVSAEVVFRSIAKGVEGDPDAEFFVYVLRRHPDAVVTRAMEKPEPGDWWSLGGAEALAVRRVDLSVGSHGLARARATFVVPDVAPGVYKVMLCDAGCRDPLPDVVPTRLRVVADPATAALVERAERLERRLGRQGRLLAAAHAAAVRARAQESTAQRKLGHVERRVDGIARGLRDRETVQGRAVSVDGRLLAAGAVLALLAILAFRRVRRSRTPAAVAGSRSTDEELAELLSERGPRRAPQSSVK
jgi:hypothetical protein